MKKLIASSIIALVIPVGIALAADGKAIYDKSCAKCHGADGKGDTTMGRKLACKDYSDAKVQSALTDEAATKAVKEGYTTAEGKQVMKPSQDLSEEDVKAVVAYLRTLKK